MTKSCGNRYPLSPMQQGMLILSLYSPPSGMYIQQVTCSLNENLNVSAFKRAWQEVINRHQILGTRFHLGGSKEILQEVQRNVVLPCLEQDWSGLSATEREEKLEDYLQDDRQCRFKFTSAPLMRLSLFRITECHYQFVWTYHHMLLDGRSCFLVLKELFAFYEAYCRSQDLQLEQPRPYRDYIAWLGKQNFTDSKSFWVQVLNGFTIPTPLALDHSHGNAPDLQQKYGVQEIRLSEEMTKTLQSLAQQNNLTLNTLVQGAWALLLNRYSGEEDVVFGATRACRQSALERSESMVGLFINTLPVRVRVFSGMRLLPWLKELRSQWVAMRPHEHTPLVNIQQWSDVNKGEPLFNSILVFENFQLNAALKLEGENWMNREIRLLEQNNFSLTLAGYAGPQLLLQIGFDRGRFDDMAISRMLGHLQTLLAGMVSDPEKRISELPLLTRVEQNQLLVEWNNTKGEYPMGQCLHELFEAQVERTPNAVALVLEDKLLTYSELNIRANQLAHYLQKLGVGPEVIVGICPERNFSLLVGLLAILKAGGAYLPLDQGCLETRLGFMLQDAGISILLAGQHVLARLTQHDVHIVCLENDSKEFTQESSENVDCEVSAGNLAYVIYTSGTKGEPKLIAVEHGSAVNVVSFTTNELLRSEELAVVPFTDSICFDPSINQIFGPLSVGGKLVILDSLFALQHCPHVDAFTCIGSTPSTINAFLDSFRLPKSVRVVSLGAEVINDGLLERLADYAQLNKIINFYGPTEATVYSSYFMPLDYQREYSRTGKNMKGGFSPTTGNIIGKPIQNVQLYLLDKHRRPVPIGVSGELHISGAGLARGYLNRPELTEEKFIPNPFSEDPDARLYRTGDLARYLPDGNIEFLGRIDNQVKIRGFRIELEEIEAVLNQHPGVEQVVVLAREDEPGNKRLVAYVVLDKGDEPTNSDLRNFLQQKLLEYMIPSVFVTLESIPLTPNGKVDRKALPTPDQKRPELEKAYAAPGTPTEIKLAEIWGLLLNIKEVGINDNFFELGGHSLLATQLISRIRDAFQVDLLLRMVFEGPIIADMALKIEQIKEKTGESEELSCLLDELEGLSDKEVKRSLEKE